MSYFYCQENMHNSPKSETTKKRANSESKAKKTHHWQNASVWKGLAPICKQFKINWGSFILSNMAWNENSEFSHGKPPRVGRRPAAATHTPQRDQALVIPAPPVLHHRPAVCFLLLFFCISNLLFWWVSNMRCSLKNIIISGTFTFDQSQAMLGANPLPGLHSPWVHRRHWADPAVLSPPAASAPPLLCVQNTFGGMYTDKSNFYVNGLETVDNAMKMSIVQCNRF